MSDMAGGPRAPKIKAFAALTTRGLPMIRIAALLCAALLAAAPPCRAADPPDKTVTLVVPFAAGGPTDTVARDLAQAMRKTLGVPILIENVGGAGGTLGATRVARASPDGQTLLLHHIGMATAPALYRNLQFKPLEDFEYAGLITEVPMTLIGRANLPATTYGDLARWLAQNGAKVNLANAGWGSASHLCGLLFQQSLKINMTTVPYKGTAPALADLLAGQIDILCDQTTNTTAPIAAGQVKAFAVTTLKPLSTPALARLPTLDGAGLKGFNVSIWHGLYAPKGTPPAVMASINAALKAALRDPEFQRRQAALGAVIVTDARVNPLEHQRFVASEIAKWAPVIKAAGVYAD
jgi:tripartite-type tricarboxylate transporter receptor subunit TctC